MKPKEKADELVKKYRKQAVIGFQQVSIYSIECAKIAVDEIIEAIDWHEFETPNKQLEFWHEVKQELEKM